MYVYTYIYIHIYSSVKNWAVHFKHYFEFGETGVIQSPVGLLGYFISSLSYPALNAHVAGSDTLPDNFTQGSNDDFHAPAAEPFPDKFSAYLNDSTCTNVDTHVNLCYLYFMPHVGTSPELVQNKNVALL